MTRDETAATGYIYGLRQKGADKFFYVGCSKYPPASRLSAHIADVMNGRHLNKHFANKVKKIGVGDVEFVTLEKTDEHRRFRAEIKWIDKLKSEGHKLVNRIHNEDEQAYAQYFGDEPTREQITSIVNKVAELLGRPIVRLKFPGFKRVESALQSLYETELETMRVINSRLVDMGYGDNERV